MREAVAAAGGAIVGTLATLLLARGPEPAPAPAPETSALLAEVRDAVSLLRRAVEAREGMALARTEPAPAAARAPAPADAPPLPEAAAEERRPARRSGVPPTIPVEDRGPLRELLRFAQEEGTRPDQVEARMRGGTRARWFLASEGEVLAAFGIPDVVSSDGDQWTYLLPTTSEEESSSVTLVFDRRGRLIHAW
jgi:hypothetical protein